MPWIQEYIIASPQIRDTVMSIIENDMLDISRGASNKFDRIIRAKHYFNIAVT